MRYIIDGKDVELTGEAEIEYLVSKGCDASSARFVQAISTGEIDGDVIELDTTPPKG